MRTRPFGGYPTVIERPPQRRHVLSGQFSCEIDNFKNPYTAVDDEWLLAGDTVLVTIPGLLKV